MTADTPKAEKGPSQATMLVDLATKHFRFGRSQTGDPFAVDKNGANVALDLRGGSSSLRAALAYLFLVEHERVPSSSALADSMCALEGRAQLASQSTVELRVGRVADRTVCLDLGRPDGHCVLVGPNSVEIADRSPILFRRTELVGPLPDPNLDVPNLDALWSLLNVAEDYRPLIAAWLVSTLMPTIPHPIPALFGEQGVGKTTTSRVLTSIIDPSPAQLRSCPRDLEQWSIAASGSWIVALDNISHIPPWLSDAMCRAVTGEGLPRRRLYSDSGISVLSFRRCILLNSIAVGTLRGDLADRLLVVELEHISPKHRRSDEELAAEWKRLQPMVLGGVLTLASEVFAVIDDIDLAEKPRMADFATVVAATDHILGTTGLKTYLGQSERLAEDVVESDPVAEAVRQLVTDADDKTWTGTAAELLETIRPERPPRTWPTSPRGIAGALKRSAPALRLVGIDIEYARSAGTGIRVYTIEKTRNRPSQPSQPSHATSDLHNRRDGRGDTDPRPSQPSHQPSQPDIAVDLHKQDPRDGRDGRDGPKPDISVTSTNPERCAHCGEGDRPDSKLRMRGAILYHIECDRPDRTLEGIAS